jgi:hypothetical protein
MLLARQAVIDVVVRYATGIDRRDWTRYQSCFTDPCRFDFSSFSGRPAADMAAADWVAAVRSVNGNFDATQHLSTNHVVTFEGPNEATCVSEMQAQHFFTPASMVALGQTEGSVNWCALGGHYTNRLVRDAGTGDWRISACTLEVRWITGDLGIFALARTMGDRG